MGLRSRHESSGIPEVDLVPMMDVLMTVLTFFVIISMELSGVQIFGVSLPQAVSGVDEEVLEKAEPLVIGLRDDGQTVYEDEAVTIPALAPIIQEYFAENPEGFVLLKADRTLPYADVAKLLADLRSIGGKKVSLAVE
ncbi:ExbD/TolR family protein [Leptothoe sp. PORK10 BA2]|uniref:ExbD/TolR family protein n=1 Tax=Leptothoe sp. PORK10 BA2 TaxID=3110254 RepID=UPI002B2059F3|nr:biopolymer transporter ExbD [Leptothoe sp. PORK10 BA2]MEA5463233.1 biopolymer transporter ExbD [Leptothoe sp. PORK10 BA2]